MSDQIEIARVQQFQTGIMLLQQQLGTNLRPAVMVDSDITGDRAFYDQVGVTEMSPVTNRHGDTRLTDTPHSRRMVTMQPFDVADMIDNPDKVRTLNDPTNTYVRAFAAAAGRTTDDKVIAALGGTAATGVDGQTSVALPSAQIIVDGGTNMTIAKLRETRQILESGENMEDDGDNRWYIVMSAKERKALLATTEVTSADFNTVRALVAGQIDQFMGFTFLKSERLTLATNIRQCFAWVKSSMQLGVSSEGKGFIDIRADKQHSTQVRYTIDLGAVRMTEPGVVRIDVDQTA